MKQYITCFKIECSSGWILELDTPDWGVITTNKLHILHGHFQFLNDTLMQIFPNKKIRTVIRITKSPVRVQIKTDYRSSQELVIRLIVMTENAVSQVLQSFVFLAKFDCKYDSYGEICGFKNL
jgi:hypothetical protein